VTVLNLVYPDVNNEPGVATAPGPITPEHESGSWEQTLGEAQPEPTKREPEEKPAA